MNAQEKRLYEERHEFLELFLDQYKKECFGGEDMGSIGDRL